MKNHERGLYLVYSLNTSGEDPACIRPGKSLYFSTKEKAEEVILSFKNLYTFLYDDSSAGEHIYCIVLEEFELDSPYRYQLSTRVYSPNGLLLSDCIVPDDGPFFGRTKNRMHHDIGDVVELPYGEKLMFGIVIEQPACFNEEARSYGTASDDCYTVIHHPSCEVNYAHAPMVFKPTRDIQETVREDLLQAFDQIVKERSI
jgi:hypothetical protein